MKKHISTVILVLVFFIGLSLLLYPSISDYWNSLHQSRAISNYLEAVEKTDSEIFESLLQEAADYNTAMQKELQTYKLTEEELNEYNLLLDITGTGMMGYVVIPSIDVSLPIYHGTSEQVMQVAAGHLEWSSLPVGGEGTHAVLSGHRGLPSAKLFTNLDKLEIGDYFLLQILNETLTYEVDQIVIVEPEETSDLMIVSGEDYCTLFTCTPYGINTHRLLVRGHRVENRQETRLIADAVKIDSLIVTPIVAFPILLALSVLLVIRTRKKKQE